MAELDRWVSAFPRSLRSEVAAVVRAIPAARLEPTASEIGFTGKHVVLSSSMGKPFTFHIGSTTAICGRRPHCHHRELPARRFLLASMPATTMAAYASAGLRGSLIQVSTGP